MMNADIKTTAPETVAYISMHGPYDQIPQAMGVLYGWVAQHGFHAQGMPEGVYVDDPQVTPVDLAAWELRAPIAEDTRDLDIDESLCGIKHVAPHMVAFTMHRGAYDTIADTYTQLFGWIAEHGYQVAGPTEELYYSDPQTTKPDDYLTEIRIPVAQAH